MFGFAGFSFIYVVIYILYTIFFFFLLHLFCWIICISPQNICCLFFLNVWSYFGRRVCRSNVTLVSCKVGAVFELLFTFVLLTLLHGLCLPVWCGIVTHGWPLGSGHSALTCEPPGRPVWVGPTVTPHAVTLDWGCHAWIDFSCQVWQRFLSSMLASLLPPL